MTLLPAPTHPPIPTSNPHHLKLHSSMEEHRSHEPGIPGQYRVELYGRDAHIGVPMYRTTIFSCTIQVHTITSLLGFVHCYLLFMGTWYCFALADLLFAFLVTCYPGTSYYCCYCCCCTNNWLLTTRGTCILRTALTALLFADCSAICNLQSAIRINRRHIFN